MQKEMFSAVCTLVGITVGAGILGLPYVFYKAGFYTGLLALILVLILMTIIHLYLGEIILRTREKHQLTGLTEIYLGKKAKIIMFIANVLSIYGALTAYIVGSSQALKAILGGNLQYYNIIFILLLTPITYSGIKLVKKFETIFTPLKIIISIILSIILLKFINLNNLTSLNISNILIPYGVAVFAFTGISALPEINQELKNKKNMYKVIIIGMIVTFLVYLLFIFSVITSVESVEQVATVSLSKLGSHINLFSNIFAILAMATAFVVLSFALKENLTLDYKIKNLKAFIITISIPIILSLSGWVGFVKLLELSGAIAIGIIILMILLMHSKIKKLGDRKPEYAIIDNKIIKIIIFIILIIGIIYSIIGIF